MKITKIGFVSLLALAGCAPSLPPLPNPTVTAYRLHSGDDVRVITFGEDHLTAEFKVSDDGTIAVPLLGNVVAVGLTPNQLSDEIKSQLAAKKLLNNPSVSVEVITYPPIFVLGEVARPGQYPYSPNMTMLQAVTLAGGYTYRAVENYADIVRSDKPGQPVEGAAGRASLVLPGDVINIKERMF